MSSEAFKQEPTLTSMFQAIDRIDTQFPHGYNDLKAVVIGGGTGAPVSIRTLLSMGIQTSAVVLIPLRKEPSAISSNNCMKASHVLILYYRTSTNVICPTN